MSDNSHYRYCFHCDKWKTKSEINEVNLGDGNKTFNCNVCRKDLGDTIQIFKCHTHSEEILKVWGTLDGQNKEKIFFDKCPQKQKNEEGQSPSKDHTITFVVISILTFCLIILIIILGMIMSRKERKQI